MSFVSPLGLFITEGKHERTIMCELQGKRHSSRQLNIEEILCQQKSRLQLLHKFNRTSEHKICMLI